jgi:hypothetical protein
MMHEPPAFTTDRALVIKTSHSSVLKFIALKKLHPSTPQQY